MKTPNVSITNPSIEQDQNMSIEEYKEYIRSIKPIGYVGATHCVLNNLDNKTIVTKP